MITLLHHMVRDAVGVTLVVAASAKLADLAGFRATLAALTATRPSTMRIPAIALCGLEFVIGAALLVGLWPGLASSSALCLSGGFVAVTLRAIVERQPIECRCFGALASDQFGRVGLARASLLFLGSLLAVFAWGTGATSASNFSAWTVIVLGALSGVAVVAGGAASSTNDIRRLRRGLN